jgi:hypothetical protein
MKIWKIAQSMVRDKISSCCGATDDFINNMTPFAGLFSDIGICPKCKSKCNFIPVASQGEVAKEIGL